MRRGQHSLLWLLWMLFLLLWCSIVHAAAAQQFPPRDQHTRTATASQRTQTGRPTFVHSSTRACPLLRMRLRSFALVLRSPSVSVLLLRKGRNSGAGACTVGHDCTPAERAHLPCQFACDVYECALCAPLFPSPVLCVLFVLSPPWQLSSGGAVRGSLWCACRPVSGCAVPRRTLGPNRDTHDHTEGIGENKSVSLLVPVSCVSLAWAVRQEALRAGRASC